MATVVLQVVGAAIGGAVAGPAGAAVGRALGAAAGYAIDQEVFSKDRVIVGPRLDATRMQASSDGTPIPRVYGRNRISGQIIWATRFEERRGTRSVGGGKGTGPSTKSVEFAYFANFAVGLCEGEIAGISRIWADGKEIDRTRIEHRVHPGNEGQPPDPLIEAKQGVGNAPAYRGLAYVVFEDFDLTPFGNRLPQLSFEVLRPVGNLEKSIRNVTVIPGSTEYGYDPDPVDGHNGLSAYEIQNRHTLVADTDWAASIDELQMLCPNLEEVALVVTWFGDDLRAGQCQIEPGVTYPVGMPWQVADRQRHNARFISRIDGKPAFGGTPNDASVSRAIADLKARGLRVTLYPFIMMDVPADSGLADPWGQEEQPAYPWRGNISCHPAPGQADTIDQTSEARQQVEAFAGVNSSVPAGYRKMILHYATLASNAGGVDGFLIGSELRGLTQVRDETGAFPFVDVLVQLAADVRSILGSDCRITYGADWSEYFGYQSPGSTDDLLYNLDPLWASADIDAIGIDNYMPLSDWRDAGDPAEPSLKSGRSPAYLRSNVAGGEGYDWYYADDAARRAGARTPITDGLGKPWIWRYKDIVSWWSNEHRDRVDGVEAQSATAWQPASKPVWLTELGCAAMDRGGNQPNVFPDRKSSQDGRPWFSLGRRDDLMQRRFLEAHFEHWGNIGGTENPVSASYGGPMLPVAWIAPWAWDARPFPAFPQESDVWSDGDNWQTGHWLNGRLGGCSLPELVEAIAEDFGHPRVRCEASAILDGYIVPGGGSARAAFDPLVSLFGLSVSEEDGWVVFRDRSSLTETEIDQNDLVLELDVPKITRMRTAEHELPSVATLSHSSVFGDHAPVSSQSRRIEGVSDRQITMDVPASMPPETAVALADERLRESWSAREHLEIRVSDRHLHVVPGDLVKIPQFSDISWHVDRVEVDSDRLLRMRSAPLHESPASSIVGDRAVQSGPLMYGQPHALLLDLPIIDDAARPPASHVAISAAPWARNYSVNVSPSGAAFERRATIVQPALTGELVSSLQPGAVGRWDLRNKVHAIFSENDLASADELSVLAGGNRLAVKADVGGYELLQFRHAELQPDGSWILSHLLRGQSGTEAEMLAGSGIGQDLVLLDEAVTAIELSPAERALDRIWSVGPAADPPGSATHLTLQHQNHFRSMRMLSPVHLKANVQPNGDAELEWIRRSRFGSDSWEPAEINLDAPDEYYRVRIEDGNGGLRRTIETSNPMALYPLSDRLADFSSSTTAFQVHVSQRGPDGLFGDAASVFVQP